MEKSPMSENQNVFARIAAVQGELAKSGIEKGSRNAQQGYNFRGIDAVYNALAPLLAKHGLCILPRMVSREREERTNRNGGAMFYVTVEAEFDFVSSGDGSKHTVRTYGEAMDSGDKATNKAMSAAYKYAALMTFAIPTEGDNDADATTHEVAPRTISDADLVKVQSYCQALGDRAVSAVLKKSGVDALDKIPADMAQAAIEWLENQLARKAKAEQALSANDLPE